MKKKQLSDIQTPIPRNISPMLATLADQLPEGNNWFFEIKWDGYRALSICEKNKVNLISRNNKSFNDKYYSIREALEEMNLEAILDGEIVAVQDSGISNFENLQDWRSEADGKLIYYVFDILWLNGYDLTQLTLEKRRKILNNVIPTEEGTIRQSFVLDSSNKNILEASKEIGLEGVIAKRADSLYYPGIRSKSWLKIKIQNLQEVVIGGFTKNEKTPKQFSSLLVGVYKNKSLEYTGKIGTGFNQKTQKEIMQRLKPLLTNKCPFSYIPDVNKPSRFNPNPPHAEAFWVIPKLVCNVNYREITRDGIMRHPSFKGLREDKNAKDVQQEVFLKTSNISKTSKIPIKKESKPDRRTLLNPTEETQIKVINGYELKFNHLSKIFWPEEGYTKRDLLNYYYQVAPYLLPYLIGRPQSLNRFPNGIEGLSFYQKDVTGKAPEWIKQYPYRTSEGEDKNFLVVENEYDLLWMANLGAIEMNPWNSTIDKPDFPTWCMIDIDPTEKNTFEQVIETARATKSVLDALKIEGYCKTSGSTGLHIYIPMGEKYTYDQCQLFGRMIATHVNQMLPKITSIERLTINRGNKIYIDFLQNRPKATLAAPYSVRPKPGASVSMPLHWEEVKKGLKTKHFNLKNAMQRIKTQGDLFKPVIGKGIDLEKTLKLFENLTN